MQYQFPYRYRVLVLLFFLTLITYLDRVCISVVGVRIKTEFHLTNEQFGWVNGAIRLLWVLACFLWFKNNPSEVKGVSDEERNFIERNRRFVNHKQPFSWKIVLKNRRLRALVRQLFCSQWAQYFFIAWMPVYLQEGKHFSENGMKTVTSYFFIIGIAGVLSAGFLIDFLVKRKGLRFGRRFFGMIPLS